MLVIKVRSHVRVETRERRVIRDEGVRSARIGAERVLSC